MIFKNKSKFLYKKILNLRNNPQNKKKVLNFKKQKWAKFVKFYAKKLKWYKKFKAQNLDLYLVSKYSNKYFSYQKRFKNTLQAYKNFNLFYGNLGKKRIKAKIYLIKNKKINNLNTEFIEIFERRLDVTLYRAKFCHSIPSAGQLIKHKKVLVNNKYITSKAYLLKTGDLIEIDLNYSELIKSNIRKSHFWPIPPKHLIINYKTFQIIFGDIKHTNLSFIFPFYLNLEKILINYPRQ